MNADSSSPAHGKLVLLIGPSGVGKSVILQELKKRHPEFHFPRSATTRQQREGEGEETYHFLTDTEFDKAIEDDKFLEYQTVHATARYGTLLREILPPIDAGSVVIRELEVQGFETLRHDPRFSGPAARYPLQSIFILPESKQQLINHIHKRAPMSDAELKHRMESMEKELAFAPLCDGTVVSREGGIEQVVEEVERVIGV